MYLFSSFLSLGRIAACLWYDGGARLHTLVLCVYHVYRAAPPFGLNGPLCDERAGESFCVVCLSDRAVGVVAGP